jgi:hypothetical protein
MYGMENEKKKVELKLITVFALYRDAVYIRTRLPVSVYFRFCCKPDEHS